MLPHCLEGLGEDSGVAEDGHEVGVAVPARDDVEVEVAGDAGAGGFAEVDADVEAVGLEGFLEEPLGFDGGVHEACAFFVVEVFQVGDFSEGEDEEVAGVVGVAVHEDEGAWLAGDDEGGLVVFEHGEGGEGASLGGRLLLGDVLHSPVGVKVVHGGGKGLVLAEGGGGRKDEKAGIAGGGIRGRGGF